MTGHEASDLAGTHIRLMRKARGWSVTDLAARCAELGDRGGRLTGPVIENIEHGRRKNGERTRDITVDELLILAEALSVPPGTLLSAFTGITTRNGEVVPFDLGTAMEDMKVAMEHAMDAYKRISGIPED